MLKSLSYSIIANGINLMISMMVAFVIPKALGVLEYSYWQLYSFYISYVGFFHFGWADGIYLRFGGKKYDELDKRYFATQFWLLTALEVIICIIIGMMAAICVADKDKMFILMMTGICCIVQIPRTLLQYLLQTTNRITTYARNFMLERTIYALLTGFFLFLGNRQYKVLLVADLIAKFSTLLLLCYACRDIVWRHGGNIVAGCKEAWINISIGIKLMFANIASMLVIGIIRLSIESYWNVEVFGKVSFTITISNMLMIFISAVSVVMYPLLKNTPENKLSDIYTILRSVLMLLTFGMLIMYYPVKELLSAWLPQYAESLRYMALLFPMCVFESKTSMLTNTYLKALRQEKVIMKINWHTLIMSLVSTFILVFLLGDLTLTVASIVFLLAIRSMMSEYRLAKLMNIKIKKDMLLEFGLAVIFVVVSWNIQTWECAILYALAYIMYMWLCRNEIKQAVKYMKCYWKEKRDCAE